ncbi:hypothetical protein NIES267_26940 [Calothrix parasitica NIES-267]|uniref:Uncharacterized protein n=1 Tax=Calothrix parasitica NIES-267 TaxID=1973488 RepID=A0A1Z4LPR3_9CYAN|nr:hypothetical protein NIES267_26940 [Calothrix parasitica NIES-267]
MYPKFESLAEENEFIIFNNIVFNTSQIKENIINGFKTKNSDLNFCSKNKFLRLYFREINNQSIFNRIEWKFWLKKDVQCELITFDTIKPLNQLQLRIILDFSSTLKAIDNTSDNQQHQENKNAEYLNLDISLDFACKELEPETTPKIDNIETVSLKNLYEQNTTYFHSFSGEEICI